MNAVNGAAWCTKQLITNSDSKKKKVLLLIVTLKLMGL